MSKHLIMYCICLVWMMHITGCSSDDNDSVKVESIVIANLNEDGKFSIPRGDSIKVEANVSPQSASSRVVYESNYTDVITVSPAGMIKAFKDGDAVITVRSIDDHSVYAEATVSVYTIPVPTQSLSFPQAKGGVIELEMSKKLKIEVDPTPANITNTKRRFESSDMTVFTVDENTGEITGIGLGTAKLKVYALDGSGVVGECEIKIVQVNIRFLKMLTSSVELGKTFNVSQFASIQPSNATIKTLLYESSNESVFTVGRNTGVITGVSIGEATLKVTTTDGTDITTEAKVRVVGRYIELDRTNFSASASSTKEGNGGAGVIEILNNKTNTWWHCNYHGYPLPHTIIVDMKEVKNIASVYLMRKAAWDADTKHIEIETSTDGFNYVKQSEVDYGLTNAPPHEKYAQFYPVEARFVRLSITESIRGELANLVIFRVYGFEDN